MNLSSKRRKIIAIAAIAGALFVGPAAVYGAHVVSGKDGNVDAAVSTGGTNGSTRHEDRSRGFR